MKRTRKDKDFIKKPTYPGGQKALNAFVYSKLKFPKEALKAKVQGSVYIRYSIDAKGNVIDTHVISSLGHGCDEEAIRVVKLLKFQVEKAFKARVLFHKKIRIWFKPQKQQSPSQSITYQIKPKAKAQTKPTSSTKPSYGYTITIKPK